MVAGDFNNMLRVDDRVGGNTVTNSEFKDIQEMMDKSELFACQTSGDRFTWSNRPEGLIYSRIDQTIGNLNWFLKYGQ